MKTKKILGSLMVAFAAVGMIACNPTVDTNHTHEFKDVEDARNVAATCTSTGKQVQKCECGEEKEVTVAKLKHTLVDDSARNKDATCTEAGVANAQKCSVCGTETQTTVPALGHAWVDDADQTGVTQATCTEAGESKQTCSRCDEHQTIAVEALGHTWGEFENVKEPTCTEAGEQKHTCSVCHTEESEAIAALGHDYQLIGEAEEPEPGKAKVRVYTCANSCGDTNLGFKATEVSEESKKHLVFDEEGGASFWGRPIGNSLELDESGTSVNQQNNEIVYNKNETGDFFEYVFDLTAEQAEALSTCRLYCDAKPASWLSGDFWAYNANNTDWTPGHYIDDDPEHLAFDKDGNPIMVDELDAEGNPTGKQIQQGKRIEDYRYILYVDGKVQEFDSTISVPVEGSGMNPTRKEYVMPFTFHLHAGENRISLRMAGGYRSTFYNFLFRPYEETTTPPVGEHTEHSFTAEGAKVGDLQPLSCTCDTTAYDLDHTGGKIKADKTWNITGITAGEYEIYLDGHASTGNGGSNFTSNQVKDGHASRYAFQVGDNAEVYITDDSTYSEFGWEGNDNAPAKYTVKPVAKITIQATDTQFKMNWHGDGYSAYINHVRLVKVN